MLIYLNNYVTFPIGYTVCRGSNVNNMRRTYIDYLNICHANYISYYISYHTLIFIRTETKAVIESLIKFKPDSRISLNEVINSDWIYIPPTNQIQRMNNDDRVYYILIKYLILWLHIICFH